MPTKPGQPVEIRAARPAEAGFLSALALRSKAHWGYSKAFLDACRAELTVEAGRLGSADYRCFVAALRGEVIGFYTVETIAAGKYELEALFVEPEYIGTGVGRLLIEHAIGLLAGEGASCLTIQGDPNASRFYRAAGARQIGSRESASIPGRKLPVFEIRFGGG